MRAAINVRRKPAHKRTPAQINDNSRLIRSFIKPQQVGTIIRKCGFCIIGEDSMEQQKPSGKIPKTQPPQAPKKAVPKPPELPENLSFSDDPRSQPTVVLPVARDEDVEIVNGKLQLKQPKTAKPSAPQLPPPRDQPKKEETVFFPKQHPTKVTTPTLPPQPVPLPASTSQTSTGITAIKQIASGAQAFLAMIEQIYASARAGIPSQIVHELHKDPQYRGFRPEQFMTLPAYKEKVEQRRNKLEEDREALRRMVSEHGFYRQNQANTEVTLHKLQEERKLLEEQTKKIVEKEKDLATKAAALDKVSGSVSAEAELRAQQVQEMYETLEGQRATVSLREENARLLEERLAQDKVVLTKARLDYEANMATLQQMIEAYQQDEASLQERQSALETLQASYDEKLTDLTKREEELAQHRSDLDIASKKLLQDHSDFEVNQKNLQADQQIYDLQKQELDKARAAYEKDKAQLDALAKELQERNETLAKGYKQVEKMQLILAKQDDDLTKRTAELNQTIEQKAQEIAETKIKACQILAEQLHKAAHVYTSQLGMNQSDLLKLLKELGNKVQNTNERYKQEDEKRRQNFEEIYAKIKSIVPGNGNK